MIPSSMVPLISIFTGISKFGRFILFTKFLLEFGFSELFLLSLLLLSDSFSLLSSSSLFWWWKGGGKFILPKSGYGADWPHPTRFLNSAPSYCLLDFSHHLLVLDMG